MHANCPDCDWQTFCVIGRVDRATLTPRPWWQRLGSRDDPFTERAGPLLKCARCGSEFYLAGGQVQKFLVGFQQQQTYPEQVRTRTSGAHGSNVVNVDFGGADDVKPPPD